MNERNPINKASKSIKEAADMLVNPQYRPQYHFLPPALWMNDPNGTIWVNGKYHLFYQHNPFKNKWGTIHWGHAESKDLVHWEHLPIALSPLRRKREKHCFSGCCVLDNEIPKILYTKIGRITDVIHGAETWMAIGSKDLIEWKRHEENPIMTDDIHGDEKVRHWRDPFVWKEGGEWFCIQGGHYRFIRKGSVYLYKSDNLIDWTYLGVLYKGTKQQGWNFECPNFLKLKDKHLLIVSPHGKVIYGLGKYQEHEFKADYWHFFDHGESFYATNTLKDGKNRSIVFGWIKGGGKGWKGCMSLPRVINEDNYGHLTMKPVPELETIRKNHHHEDQFVLEVGQDHILNSVMDSCVEIKAEIILDDHAQFGFILEDCKKDVFIGLNCQTKEIIAGEDKGKILDINNQANPTIFHLFLDKSVIELFLNYRECMTGHFYPKKDKKFNIALTVRNGSATIKRLDYWNLNSIW